MQQHFSRQSLPEAGLILPAKEFYASDAAVLADIGRDILPLLRAYPIVLRATTTSVSQEDLRVASPDLDLIAACDFYVTGAETGRREPYGFVLGNIINIDHHADVPEMAAQISSGNLAAAYLRSNPPLRNMFEAVVLHHTDCDSFISGCMMRGIIPPHPAFEAAVIAADHTGKANPIADLLQPLQPHHSLELSGRALASYLNGQPLPPEAVEGLRSVATQRALAREIIESGRLVMEGSVALVVTDIKVESEYLAPLLPGALVVAIASPRSDSAERLNISLRLGPAAPRGFSLHDLKISELLDPCYGGRWNAGSNRRGGGTAVNPRAWAAGLNLLIQRQQAMAPAQS